MRRLAFWLMPAAEERRWLDDMIDELARRYDAPRFAPHVTIFVGGTGEAVSPTRALEVLGDGVPPFDLAITGTSHSAEFTKTLFLELGGHAGVEKLAERASALCTRSAGYTLKPHVSLLYAPLSNRDREAAAAAVRPPKAAIRFDGLQLVDAGERTASRRDVEAWRVLCAHRLHG